MRPPPVLSAKEDGNQKLRCAPSSSGSVLVRELGCRQHASLVFMPPHVLGGLRRHLGNGEAGDRQRRRYSVRHTGGRVSENDEDDLMEEGRGGVWRRPHTDRAPPYASSDGKIPQGKKQQGSKSKDDGGEWWGCLEVLC